MNSTRPIFGHIAALLTITVWSITPVSTKVLLESFNPIEILWIRFLIGAIALKVIYPKSLGFNKQEEPFYILGGFLGIFLYFLTENIAINITTAVNVGIILAVTPLLTAIVNKLFYHDDNHLTPKFFIGALAALLGVVILSLQGSSISLNPLGDMLALSAGLVWSFYSAVCKKISTFGHNAIATTRRTFVYGLIFITIGTMFAETSTNVERFLLPQNFGNLLFLGCLASAMCFATWNYAVSVIGSVTSIIYLYASPIITVIFAYLILRENLTWQGFLGCGLIILGLILSQNFKKLHPHKK